MELECKSLSLDYSLPYVMSNRPYERSAKTISGPLFAAILFILLAFAGFIFVVPFIKKVNFERFLTRLQEKPEFKNAIISVLARYENEATPFVSLHGDAPIHPGSNFKLFTAAISLARLGQNSTFSTSLSGRQRGGKINLLLVGGGDPTFQKEDLEKFVEAVRSQKLPVGRIFYDDRKFNGERFGPDWPKEWRDQYFAVPITGLQINDNLLDIFGGEMEDRSFQIVTGPLENYEPIVDAMTYFDDPEKLSKPITATMAEDGTVTLHGDTMKGLPFITSSTVQNPSEMTAKVFKQMLQKSSLASEKTPVQFWDGTDDIFLYKTLYKHRSKPLKDIVFTMLKFSKNNYAETLVRKLGGGNQKTGVEVLKEFIEMLGIRCTRDSGTDLMNKTQLERFTSNCVAFDGSGMSPSTRVTGRAILKLFDYINNGQPWRELFWNSLPTSKIDGTLKQRFQNVRLRHTIVAKTGTHIGSSSLSGKIIRGKGRDILFSVHIFNHPFSTEESVTKVIPVIDKIVASIDKQF